MRLPARRAAHTAAAAAARADLAYCADVVRKLDFDNYLWIALLSPPARPAALALRAFNAETAAAAAAATAPAPPPSALAPPDAGRALAVGRALWWKDAASAAAAGTPPAHPVARALAAVAAAGRASPAALGYRLGRVAAARAADAAATAPPPTVAALETYGEETAAQVLYLHLDAAGVGKEGGGAARGGAAPRGPPAAPASVDAAHHAASHVGVAAAITGLLRGTASHARGRRCYLPADVLAATGCSEEAVFRAAAADLASAPPPPPPLTAAVAEVAAVARGHLAAARGLAGEVAPGAVPYLRQAVGVGRALDALAAAGHNPLHPWVATGGGPSARAGLVWATRWAGWRGRY